LRGPVESGQYTSIDYTQTLTDHGVLASVGSVGDADDALAKSFVDSFKTELIADRVWRTRSQLWKPPSHEWREPTNPVSAEPGPAQSVS
jgi:transposase InsO family protein